MKIIIKAVKKKGGPSTHDLRNQLKKLGFHWQHRWLWSGENRYPVSEIIDKLRSLGLKEVILTKLRGFL